MLQKSPERILLRYVLENHYQVSNLALKPGDITIGAYWSDKPCTLYQWYDAEGREIGDYFNVADQIEFADDQVSWRDLVLDVLIIPGERPAVLDGKEIPRNCSEEILSKIYLSKQYILIHYPEMIQEVRNYVAFNRELLFNHQIKETR